VIHNTFGRSMDTISCYFKQAMYAIGEMSAKMIKTLTGQKPAKIKKNDYIWWPYFRVSTNSLVSSH
jgi:hypothetical protein